MSKKRVYLDNNSTMEMLPEVQKLMVNLMARPLNPSSLHESGRHAKALIEEARKQVAELVGVDDINRGAYKLIFTSSGTESNNLILQNFREADVFVSSIEHTSLLKLQEYLPNIKVVCVNKDGMLDLDHLEHLLAQSNADKKLVSVMLANNETGIIQPLQKVVEIARKYGAEVHSDAVQALGKIEVNLPELDLDFMTVSAHKFGGPVGAAGLFYKSCHHIVPLMIGGGQERGGRSGTENVLAITGFGKAAEVIKDRVVANEKHLRILQQRLEKGLSIEKLGSRVIGCGVDRLPNTSLIVTPLELAERQLIALDLLGIEVSAGSACSSGKVGRSHVLEAMGLPEDEVGSAIRISTSPNNTVEEIDRFIETFAKV
jgi:cysteine desulfurase